MVWHQDEVFVVDLGVDRDCSMPRSACLLSIWDMHVHKPIACLVADDLPSASIQSLFRVTSNPNKLANSLHVEF